MKRRAARKQGQTEPSQTRHQHVDFGTYHHTTSEESIAFRKHAQEAFSKLLRPLYPASASLQILDAGCGLGFLISVAAQCFPNARVTGVDLFRHASIAGMSMRKAMRNMELLGIQSRTDFRKHDLAHPLDAGRCFDLVLSNVVFHNLGKKRFKAYQTIFDALKPGGYFVIGDLFPNDDADMDSFLQHAKLVQEIDESGSTSWPYKIKVLRRHPPLNDLTPYSLVPNP